MKEILNVLFKEWSIYCYILIGVAMSIMNHSITPSNSFIALMIGLIILLPGALALSSRLYSTVLKNATFKATFRDMTINFVKVVGVIILIIVVSSLAYHSIYPNEVIEIKEVAGVVSMAIKSTT